MGLFRRSAETQDIQNLEKETRNLERTDRAEEFLDRKLLREIMKLGTPHERQLAAQRIQLEERDEQMIFDILSNIEKLLRTFKQTEKDALPDLQAKLQQALESAYSKVAEIKKDRDMKMRQLEHFIIKWYREKKEDGFEQVIADLQKDEEAKRAEDQLLQHIENQLEDLSERIMSISRH